MVWDLKILMKLRQGKYFEIDTKENDPKKAKIKLKKCVKNF